MLRYLITCLIALATAYPGSAQTFTVRGQVTDAATHAPVEFATVTLLQVADSSLAGGTISDSTGHFEIPEIPAGTYLPRISFIGYRDTILTSVSVTADIDLGNIGLQAMTNELGEVVVTGSKKVVETIPGGIVYNADQVLSNANGTVLDMLKNVPNIIVDKDEHVTIRGNAGVNVMVDGVPLNMSGDDLTNFLKQIPSDMISSVEVITTPGAKYDAAGSAGILNLKTKKQNTNGKNGTVKVGGGTLGSYEGSVNYYMNQNKVRFSAAYNYNHNVFRSDAYSLRENYDNPDYLYLYDEHFDQDGNSDNHLAKVNLDYLFNDKNTLGGSLSYGRKSGIFSIDDNLITEYADGMISGSYRALLHYDFDGDNYSANTHYNHDFSKQGHNIAFDLNYSSYAHNRDIPSSADFYDADGNIIPGLSTMRNDATDFNVSIFSGKSDYVLPLNEKSKLETGIKYTQTQTDNILVASVYDDMLEWQPDPDVSNAFYYTEAVSAAYANYSGGWKQWTYAAGLRLENTDIHTESPTADATYNRNYTDLFPSGNIKYGFTKGGDLSLDYSRRIERPVYQWLNPFVDKSTPYTWFTGNPELKPYYTDALTLSYSKFIKGKHYVMGSIFYQHMDDIFTQYFEYAEGGVYYMTIKNINSQTNTGASAMVQSGAAKWLDVLVNMSVFRNDVNNDLAGVDIESKYTFTAYSSLTFKFWKGTRFQLTGNYMSPSTNPQGYFNGFYSVEAGLKRSFLSDRLSVNLNVRDIFNSMEFSNTFVDAHFHTDFSFKPQSRIASISLSWKFGDAIQNLLQEHNTGEEDRVNFDRQ
ncbi:MAG: TonB-dependent receptor [Chitinophagales bacterium]